MEDQADVVSAKSLAASLEQALPQLEAGARFESAETLGTRELIKKLQTSLGVIKSEPEKEGVMVTFRDATSAQLQTFLASQAPKEAARAGGLEAKFDSNDILGWFGSFFTWWKKIRSHAWATADAQPAQIADVARVGLLADWGTGMYGAPVCAESMAADKAGYQVLMHLGDVYYSGDDKEMEDRFLKLWPKVNGAINLGLNGNHEMYTGGQAYFGKVLKEFGQKASYAALQNHHWLLACLDTAYAEHDLANDQASWLTQLIAQAGNRKVVLFSHHQPYSILDAQGPKLVEKLRPHLEARRIHAWYWGHEHRCVVYEAHPQWGLLGRCVGHSGFPEFRKKEWGDTPAGSAWLKLSATSGSPAAVVLDGGNQYVKSHEKEYGPHGYVTLEFDNEKLTEFMHLPDGQVVKSQQIA
jgi:calcineurin-like phosphoesterase family protein